MTFFSVTLPKKKRAMWTSKWCPGTGEDRAEGARFWYAFLTPFWGPQKICFFKRNDAEAYVWPKSDTRQAQQNIVQSTNVCEVKRHMTKQKPT